MEETKDNEQGRSGVDGDNNLRVMAAIAYILFFVPMLTHRDNEYAMFHANQGLILLLAAVAVNAVGWIIPILGWFLILPLGSLAVFILWIIGIVNALNGKQKRLPLIGGFNLLTQE